MNDYLTLAALLLCHIVGDFYLQSKALVGAKKFGQGHKPLRFKNLSFGIVIAHLFHMGIHALVMMAALLGLLAIEVISMSFNDLWLAIAWISLGHFVVDIIKSAVCQKREAGDSVALELLLDQFAHVVLILAVWVALFDNLNNFYDAFTLNHFIIAGAYLLVLKPTSILVVQLLSPYSFENNDTQIPKAGKLIGYIERAVVLTLIFVNQYTAIGFIIAAKSVLRYGENGGKDTKLNEYVLLGTLASFGIVLLVGITARLLLGFGGVAAELDPVK